MFIVFFLVNENKSFITFIFSKKNNGLVRSIVLYVFGPLLTQNDFYLQSLSLFTGIDCVNGLVLNLLPNCEHF